MLWPEGLDRVLVQFGPRLALLLAPGGMAVREILRMLRMTPCSITLGVTGTMTNTGGA